MAPKIIAAAMERGVPIPERYQNLPFLVDSYQTNIMEAFWKLSTCRSMGMGTGPIPWSSVDQWAIRHQYDRDQIEYDTFVFLISELDSEFMEYQLDEHTKREAATKAANGKPRSVR